MSFKKAFQKQDAKMVELHELQGTSLLKINAMVQTMLDTFNANKPITPAEAKKLQEATTVLLARCRRYETESRKMDFVGC